MIGNDIYLWIIGILITVISYFLKATIDDLKSVKDLAFNTKNKLDLVENNHNHLTDKFDQLYIAVKDLTSEIKHLTTELAKKKE